MTKPTVAATDDAASADEADEQRAACLREEVDFWHGMLESADERTPGEIIERMTFALALAEYRLRRARAGGCDALLS